MQPAPLTKSDIRAGLLGNSGRRKRVNVEFNNVTFELLQPTVGQRADIMKSSTDSQGNINPMDYPVYALLQLAVVPGTNERIFDDTDVDTIREDLVGGFVDKAVPELNKLINVENEIKNG